jgi:hypothetical protein
MTTLTPWATSPAPTSTRALRRSTRPGTAFVPVDRDPAPEPVTRRPAGSWDFGPRLALAGWATGGTWLFLAASPDGVPVVEAAFELTWGVLSLAAGAFYLDHRTSTSKTVRPVVGPLLRLLAGGMLRAPLTAPAGPVPDGALVLPAAPAPAVRPVAVPVRELDERPVVVGVVVSDAPADRPNTYTPAEEATR